MSARAGAETRYAYLITAVEGCMVGRVKVRELLFEKSYFGRSHVWTVFSTKTAQETGGISGTYLGKAQFEDGRLTKDSRERLHAAMRVPLRRIQRREEYLREKEAAGPTPPIAMVSRPFEGVELPERPAPERRV
jgi:hypothetical protein